MTSDWQLAVSGWLPPPPNDKDPDEPKLIGVFVVWRWREHCATSEPRWLKRARQAILGRTFGGEFLTPATFGSKPAIDRPPATQALQWLYDLRHKYRIHPVQGAANAMLKGGTVATRQTLMMGYQNLLWTGEQAPEQMIAAALGPYQALLDRPRLQ